VSWETWLAAEMSAQWLCWLGHARGCGAERKDGQVTSASPVSMVFAAILQKRKLSMLPEMASNHWKCISNCSRCQICQLVCNKVMWQKVQRWMWYHHVDVSLSWRHEELWLPSNDKLHGHRRMI